MVTYPSDHRLPIEALYQSYARLIEDAPGIQRSAIYSQEMDLPGMGRVRLPPIISLRTRAKGPALWILAGIHGEEPAGPMAIAQNIELFLNLHQQGIPFVLFPLCNPKGYILDWRYPNMRGQQGNQGHSVGDCEHLLPDEQDPTRPRRSGGPICPEAEALTSQVIELFAAYPPVLSIDLHEDEEEHSGPLTAYVYSQGELGAEDPIAREIVGLLRENGFPIPKEGKTRFGESIIDGVVPPAKDGSIDELLSCSALIREGRMLKGPQAKSVLVVETPIARVPLEKRVAAHAAILRSLPRFWSMLVNHVASSELIL